MVPSPRPVYERIGYHRSSNPYNYFNAGVFIGLGVYRETLDELKAKFEIYFCKEHSSLIWNDQDVFNCYFGERISPLPFRYNVSSGMFDSANFGRAGFNYLAEKELTNAIIVHASGGILFSRRHYAFRGLILELSNLLLNKNVLISNDRQKVIKFVENLSLNPLQKQWRYLRCFFPRRRIKLIGELDSDFLMFKLKNSMRSIMKK